MAPRTKAAAEGNSEEPRRSSRIAAIPQPEQVVTKAKKPAATRKASSSKKRAVEEVEGAEPVAESSAKKTKGESDSPAEDVPVAEAEAAAPVADAPLDVVEVGGHLPHITLKNEKGEDVHVGELAAEKGVILFLVPKADTPGCTTQACGFRDVYPDFTSHNYTVYCLSADTPAAQTKWQTKKELPYPLLSDPKRVLITALGAGEGGKTKRSHFIFEKGGKLVDKKMPVKPADSPKLALEFIKSLEDSDAMET